MAITQTTRFSLYKWSASTDEFNRVQMTDSHENIEVNAAKYLAAAGAPATTDTTNTKSFYWDTTNGVLYFRGTVTGATTHSWTQLSQSYGTPTQISAINAAEGSGVALARASHVHSVSTATAVDIGATSATGNSTALAVANHVHAIPAGHITDAMINTNAAIAGTKISGTVSSASVLASARTITLSGDVTGSVSFNGSQNVTITCSVVGVSGGVSGAYQPLDADLSSIAGLTTTGMIVRTATGTFATRALTVSGSGISIANADGVSGNTALTIASASINTASTLVFRDASGNFAAGTITATLAGNASSATTAAACTGNAATVTTIPNLTGDVTSSGNVTNIATGVIYNNEINGAAAIDLSKLATTGTMTATTFVGALTGNASTATKLQTSRTIALTGDVTGTSASFDGSGNVSIAAVVVDDSHTHSTIYYTESEIHAAKLYQYANNTSGTGTALPSEAGRTTPRIFVQASSPTYTAPSVAVTGDIWFQI